MQTVPLVIPGEAVWGSRRLWPEQWTRHWPDISESLDHVSEYWADYWTKESIYASVMSGNWQAWGFGEDSGKINVIVLTQITDFPANRFLHVTLAYGNTLDECLPTIEATLQRFAMEAECAFGEITGREGWEKKLKQFRRVGVVLRVRVPKRGVH